MLRSIAVAALLLLALLWSMSAHATIGNTSITIDDIDQNASVANIAATTAITTSANITVTTIEDEINTDGDCSLREALQAAFNDAPEDACPPGSGADTIFVPANEYQLVLGQLHLTGTVTLRGSTIESTVLSGGSVSRVLYIEPDANVELWHLSIIDGDPGGAYCGDGVSAAGGGILNHGTTLIAHSTIYNNIAGSRYCVYSAVNGEAGGGIYNAGTITIVNSTISGNTGGRGSNDMVRDFVACGTGGEGGGIANSGSLTLQNSTVASNNTGDVITFGFPCKYIGKVGGVYNTGSARIENSIIAENEGSACAGAYKAIGNNLVWRASGCEITGNFFHSRARLDILRDNGGATNTHALTADSPAIDAGDCTGSNGITITVDQRGAARPQGDGCDIGAYESPYTSTFEIQELNLPLIGGKHASQQP
jgi:CSLREA domain-containing protein